MPVELPWFQTANFAALASKGAFGLLLMIDEGQGWPQVVVVGRADSECIISCWAVDSRAGDRVPEPRHITKLSFSAAGPGKLILCCWGFKDFYWNVGLPRQLLNTCILSDYTKHLFIIAQAAHTKILAFWEKPAGKSAETWVLCELLPVGSSMPACWKSFSGRNRLVF